MSYKTIPLKPDTYKLLKELKEKTGKDFDAIIRDLLNAEKQAKVEPKKRKGKPNSGLVQMCLNNEIIFDPNMETIRGTHLEELSRKYKVGPDLILKYSKPLRDLIIETHKTIGLEPEPDEIDESRLYVDCVKVYSDSGILQKALELVKIGLKTLDQNFLMKQMKLEFNRVKEITEFYSKALEIYPKVFFKFLPVESYTLYGIPLTYLYNIEPIYLSLPIGPLMGIKTKEDMDIDELLKDENTVEFLSSLCLIYGENEPQSPLEEEIYIYQALLFVVSAFTGKFIPPSIEAIGIIDPETNEIIQEIPRDQLVTDNNRGTPKKILKTYKELVEKALKEVKETPTQQGIQ